ncbi:MAG: hypothetical protein O2944_08580 [Proteobacteria bacterium]|nr:hypothetical protein [Pseudomonadota bacterium]
MSDTGYACVCPRLVALGIVEALGTSPQGEAILDALGACMAAAPCKGSRSKMPAGAGAGKITARGNQRRGGIKRRQNTAAVTPERRVISERRVNPDRRGLKAGQSYTQEQTFETLRAWCAGNCRGIYELWFDESTNLRFHFELDEDRANFMAMLRDFKAPSPG